MSQLGKHNFVLNSKSKFIEFHIIFSSKWKLKTAPFCWQYFSILFMNNYINELKDNLVHESKNIMNLLEDNGLYINTPKLKLMTFTISKKTTLNHQC